MPADASRLKGMVGDQVDQFWAPGFRKTSPTILKYPIFSSRVPNKVPMCGMPLALT